MPHYRGISTLGATKVILTKETCLSRGEFAQEFVRNMTHKGHITYYVTKEKFNGLFGVLKM